MKYKSLAKLSSLFILVFIASLTSCYFDGNFGNRIEGEGPIVTRSLDIDNFEGLVIQNSANVILTQGNKRQVEIKAQENIIDNLNTEVSGGVWKIKNIKPVWRMHEITVRITLPEFDMIRISGSGGVQTDGDFEDLNNLELRISGSGDISLDIEANDIYGRIGGSGSISLEGSAKDLDFRISGSGDIFADDLKAERADATISGSGGIRLNVSKNLDASISGSGNIYYKGRPQINTSISGSGDIHSR